MLSVDALSFLHRRCRISPIRHASLTLLTVSNSIEFADCFDVVISFTLLPLRHFRAFGYWCFPIARSVCLFSLFFNHPSPVVPVSFPVFLIMQADSFSYVLSMRKLAFYSTSNATYNIDPRTPDTPQSQFQPLIDRLFQQLINRVIFLWWHCFTNTPTTKNEISTPIKGNLPENYLITTTDTFPPIPIFH